MGKRTKHIKDSDKKKAWFQKPKTTRLERNMAIKNTFLIYCEGENTEPEYFKSFPVTTDTQVKVTGVGWSKTALVKEVIRLLHERDEDEQVWVVFDRDVRYADLEHGNNDFNNAIRLANEHGIRCAYSNDCFELWFILHDEYTESALHRNQFYQKLSQTWDCNYEDDGKSKDFARSLYQIYLPKIDIAIRNARRLHQFHADKEYCDHNPCTTVYELVEELNKNLRK